MKRLLFAKKLFKTKTRQALIKDLDKIISHLVRIRDDWTCIRCHKRYEPPTNALHCSHYFSRRYLGTRWDLNNLDALCYGCHRFVEGNKQGWYTQHKKQTLGEKEYSLLEFRANAITKYSAGDIEMLIQVFTDALTKQGWHIQSGKLQRT